MYYGVDLAVMKETRVVFCSPIHLVMVALWNRADHYIFILSFVLLSSFFLFLPNLSRCRLDVCHTFTHAVALVQFKMQV